MRYQQIILILAVSFSVGACTTVGTSAPTADQIERKERSERAQRELGVPVNPELGYLPAASDVTLLPEEIVEARVLCLLVVATKAEEMPPQVTTAIIRRYNLEGAFTEYEQSVLETEELSWRQIESARGRYESARTLLWALGLIDEIAPPDQSTNVAGMIRILSSKTPEAFSVEARLRSREEILDAADLAYRLHAAAHTADERGRMSSVEVNDSVVYEREYALKWLIQHPGFEWGKPIPDALEES